MTRLCKSVLIGSILLLTISPQLAFSQTEEDTGVSDATIKVGPKIGMTGSAFSVDNENITDTKKGLLVGGFATYRLLEFLTIQGELLYQQQGAANVDKQTDDATGVTTFQNIIMHNIDVPIFARLTVPGYPADHPIIPYISAGFDYSYNMKTYQVNKSQTEFDNGSSFRTSSFTDVSHKYKQNEMGLLFGTGFLMKTSSWMYTLDFRYRFGLTSLNNVRPDNPGNDFGSNVFSISVGVGIFDF